MKNMNKTQFCALLGDKLKPYLSPKEIYKTLNFFTALLTYAFLRAVFFVIDFLTELRRRNALKFT